MRKVTLLPTWSWKLFGEQAGVYQQGWHARPLPVGRICPVRSPRFRSATCHSRSAYSFRKHERPWISSEWISWANDSTVRDAAHDAAADCPVSTEESAGIDECLRAGDGPVDNQAPEVDRSVTQIGVLTVQDQRAYAFFSNSTGAGERRIDRGSHTGIGCDEGEPIKFRLPSTP